MPERRTSTPRSRRQPAHSRRSLVEPPGGQRARCLLRLADLIEREAEALTRQQIFENGKLVSEMRPGLAAVAGDCRFFAALAETHQGATVAPARPGFSAFTLREPVGVVAAITPWNTPLGLLGWKLFPALAAGKPSSSSRPKSRRRPRCCSPN